ncbi:hypothetical protein ACFJIS_13225 [Variovorax boronicumulans]|uniref:hypothetical protein n=1 Tax=Variovorax boronicumulans TaxID=436515 RepID=UPI0036F22DA0
MKTPLRRQLSGDLLLAMKAKDSVAISALRSVLSALDNASAVPASTVPVPVFGLNGDVPRKELSDMDCQEIIGTEIGAWSLAAQEHERLGNGDEAALLRAQKAAIERYMGTGERTPQARSTDRDGNAAPGER